MNSIKHYKIKNHSHSNHNKEEHPVENVHAHSYNPHWAKESLLT